MNTTTRPICKLIVFTFGALAALTLGILECRAAYPDPPGGWTYKYTGDQLTVGGEGTGWSSLDGTWTHDNNSDAWDGSELGGTFSTGGFGVGNGPGGASLVTQSGAAFLRMQDTGDPRDYGYPDPSNRKVYFGHNIGTDIDAAKAQTIMDTGVTLTFRARIPTSAKAGPPLDALHRDGQQAQGVQPYPANGDGYVTSDGGKGNFVIRQGGNGVDVPAGAIAFSFTTTNDTTGGDPNGTKAGFAGLTFNEFNGNVPSANVNFGQGTKTNVVAFDPTDWHELYIVIRKDPANIGTHEAFIFRDDGLVPIVFKMTAGTGADMIDSFLAMGGSATPQNWALDVDWFGYKDEAVFPPGALLPPSLFGFVPANNTLFHPAASGLSFSASALMPANRLPASGFKLYLNGQDVSSQLVLTGTDTSASRTASFNGLQPNTQYAATYIVTDSGGLSSTNDLRFDTFVEATAKIIEAEDYNYGGQFIDDPQPGAYAGNAGTAGVDFYDTTAGTMGAYRTSDAVDTAVTVDVARSKFVTAQLSDYDIATIGPGEWWNYTRTLTGALYHAWIRVGSTAAQAVRLDEVTSNAGQPNQTREFLGVFNVPRTGSLSVYSYVQLTDVQGRPIPIPGNGVTTLRLTAPAANGNLILNFLLLQPVAAASAEALVSVSPLPGSQVQPGDVPIEAAIYDGSTPVDPASVKLSVGGQQVAVTATKVGGLTTLKYSSTTLWPPASSQSLHLAFNDSQARSFDWTFSTINYPVLTPAMKVTDATTRGFVWRVHQNQANQDTSVQKVLDAMSGKLGLDNLADPSATGPASAPGTPDSPGMAPMTFHIPTVINVAQDTFGDFGNFTPDEQMPGIPGLTGGTDGIAVELTTFIQLPAGFITMGINSDDGFRTIAGFLNDVPLLLGEVDGGRSAADSIFPFGVQEAGVYAFRTLYFEGGGDASLEWFLVNANGTRVLVNDSANGGALSYQQGTIPSAPVDVRLTYTINSSGQVVLDWSAGTLLSSDTVNGTYQPVTPATKPYVVSPTSAVQKFYRVKVQ